MLIDDVHIIIQAGKGGDGAVAFRTREGNAKGGPDGGNGGNGGSIYVQGVDDLTALSKFQYKKAWKADEGIPGKRKNLFGKNADDLVIPLPVGTLVEDEASGQTFEVIDALTKHLLANGGKGGRGNNEFKSATNQTPRYAEKGELGDEKHLHLILKLIANIGLIGLPNAGKSTLLSLLTSAKPKIGDYPFTTLEPNVGMMNRVMIADIPGLIEGASEGRGLGHTFLKHIEKTQLLVHCVDASQDDLVASYTIVRKEFEKFNNELLQKPEIILLTKIDLLSESELKSKKSSIRKLGLPIYELSALDDASIENFKELLLKIYNEKKSS